MGQNLAKLVYQCVGVVPARLLRHVGIPPLESQDHFPVRFQNIH